MWKAMFCWTFLFVIKCKLLSQVTISFFLCSACVAPQWVEELIWLKSKSKNLNFQPCLLCSLLWLTAQLHEHFSIPGVVLEVRHVGQACRGPEPFLHFVSDLHLGVTKVIMELRWLSVLKMISSIMLCCLCFCFVTLMSFPCVGRRKKKIPTSLRSLEHPIQIYECIS